MHTGQVIQVKAFKADGTCYRWWQATVEAVAPGQLVVITPPDHKVEDPAGGWISKYAIRSYYWPGKRYSLLEVFTPDGQLDEVYVNINSPVEIEDGEVRFTDYELDVSRRPPLGARIVDEEEFREAAAAYGYSEEFQRTCYRAAREAVALADGWLAAGMPVVRM